MGEQRHHVSGTHRLLEAISALHTIGLGISAQTDMQSVLRRIIQTAIDLLEADAGGSIWLYDPARGELELTASIGAAAQYIGSTMRPGDGLGGRVFAEGQSIAIPDYHTWEGRSPNFNSVGYHAMLGVPLRWQDDVIGTLHFASSTADRRFTAEDMQLAEMFASQAAIAIGNVRLLESTQRRIEQVDTLRTIAVELLATTDVYHILKLIARAALTHTQGSNVHLYLYNQAANQLTFGTSLWEDGSIDKEHSTPRPDGITMTVARTGKRVLVVDPRHDPLFAPMVGWDAIAAFVSVPFRRGDEVLGVFNIAFDKQTVLDRGMLNFLDLLAAQAAVAIYNAQLFAAAEHRANESDRLRTVAVEILSSTNIISILHRIGQEAIEHCGAEDVRIYLYDQANDRLSFGTALDDSTEDAYPPRPTGLTAIVARTGNRMVITDPRHHPLFANLMAQQDWYFEAVVGVPLKRGGEVIGVMNTIFTRRINDETLRFLDLLAAQAAVAIENARLFEGIAQRVAEYARLRDAALALLSATDMRSMLAAIAHAAISGIKASFIYIYQYDGDSDTFQLGASVDATTGETMAEFKPPRSDGLTAAVAHGGERIIVVNPQSHPLFTGRPDVSARWHEVYTIVGLPLKEGSRVVGVMNVFFADRVGDEVLTFLDLLAAQGVVGFKNMALYEAERTARNRADAALTAALTLSSTISLSELLGVVLDECAKVLPVVSGAILIYEEGVPSIVALKGYEGRESRILSLMHEVLKGDRIHQRMMDAQAPVIIPDVREDPDWTIFEEGNHIRGFIGVPLIARGEVIGSVTLDSDQVNAFTSQHVEMAQALASHAAVAIENVRLLNRTRETIDQLEAYFHASRSLITATAPEELLRAVAAPALASGSCNAALVYIDSDENNNPTYGEVMAITQEPGGPTLPEVGTHVGASELTLGRYVRRYRGRVLTVPKIDLKRTHNALTLNLLKGMDAQALGIIPLMLGDRLVGLIALLWSQPYNFSDQEIQFYQVLSPQLAAVVDNRRLFEATRSAQERFRDIALSTSDWVWETDSRGRVTFCTERIADSLGYTPQDYIGHTFYEFMNFEEAKRVRHIINTAAAERRPIEGMEYWALHHDGQRVDLSTSAVPILDERRGVIGFRGVSKDITEQRRAVQREQLAYEIAQRMTSMLSLADLTSKVVDQLHQAFGYFPVSLFFFDEDTQTLTLESEAEEVHGKVVIPLDKQPSLIALAARRREAVVSNNTAADPNHLIIDMLHETRSEACFPLLRGEKLIGVLDVQSSEIGRFSEAEVRALVNVAAHVSIAIENARLYEAERAARDRGEALREAAKVLSSTLSLDEVLETILKQCRLGVPYVTSTIVTFKNDRPVLSAISGDFTMLYKHEEKLEKLFEVSPILNAIVEYQEPVIIRDVPNEPDWVKFPHEERIQCWMGVPMVTRETLVGILMLYGDETVRFTTEHLEFTQGLAAHAAIALENARLYSHLEDLVEDRTAEVVRQQERLKAIVASAGEAILFTDPNGLIEFANPAWERLSGFESSFVLGKPVFQFMGNATQVEMDGITATMQAGGVWEGEIHARRTDGSEYDAAVTAAPVMDQAGKLVNVVGVIRDITVSKEVERMRRKFVHNISHELRTPITNLKLFHALVRTGPSARREEYLDTIAGELARLERLIEDLLDISRLDQGVLSMRPAVIDLNEIVREAQRAQQVRAEERGKRLEIDLYDALPPIYGDRERIMQVIVNLLTNAINYTNEGDTIGVKTYLTVRDEQPTVALKVWDTGIGIAPEELPFIFNRFYRAENAKVEGIPGTGLGLSIVKEIIEMHEGHVIAESEKGKGTSFTFYLPIAQMGEAEGIAEPRKPL